MFSLTAVSMRTYISYLGMLLFRPNFKVEKVFCLWLIGFWNRTMVTRLRRELYVWDVKEENARITTMAQNLPDALREQAQNWQSLTTSVSAASAFFSVLTTGSNPCKISLTTAVGSTRRWNFAFYGALRAERRLELEKAFLSARRTCRCVDVQCVLFWCFSLVQWFSFHQMVMWNFCHSTTPDKI